MGTLTGTSIAETNKTDAHGRAKEATIAHFPGTLIALKPPMSLEAAQALAARYGLSQPSRS